MYKNWATEEAAGYDFPFLEKVRFYKPKTLEQGDCSPLFGLKDEKMVFDGYR